MNNFELGAKYSKLTIAARKNLIKKYSAKLKEIDKLANRRRKAYDKQTQEKKKIGDESELRNKINLLKHTYHIGDYVVIKEKTTAGADHKICNVLTLIGVKDHIIADTTIPLKNAFVKLKVNEKNIICSIEAIRSIPTIKYHKEDWQGKITANKKINK